MKIFISWSGTRSKAVAELFKEWISLVLQASRPWISSTDIDRGAIWFTEIIQQLQGTSTGIICLTRDNLDKPWILFEAGALAQGLSTSRVLTFLVDIEPTDVKPPLSEFNHTLPTKENLWMMVSTLNRRLPEDHQLQESTLENVFNTYWPRFQEKLQEILKEVPAETEEVPRTDDSILEEILRISRGLDKRVRFLEQDKFVGFRQHSAPELPPARLRSIVRRVIRQAGGKATVDEILNHAHLMGDVSKTRLGEFLNRMAERGEIEIEGGKVYISDLRGIPRRQ